MSKQTPHDIWLAGDEHIHLISELLDPKEDNEGRASGRTTRLAIKHVQLALNTPGIKIIIKDHHKSKNSTYILCKHVLNILDVLGVAYDTGLIGAVEPDPNSFTGMTKSSNVYYVTVAPIKPIEEVPMPF